MNAKHAKIPVSLIREMQIEKPIIENKERIGLKIMKKEMKLDEKIFRKDETKIHTIV